MRSLLVALLVVLLAAAVFAARTRVGREAGPTAASAPRPAATAPPTTSLTTPLAVPTLGPPTKTSDCQYRRAADGAALPDPACTPGAANPELTRAVLCAPGFTTRRYRRVTDAQRRSAYQRYGIVSHAAGAYEVDHLLAIEDGGANDDANLWPEPASPEPGFHQKDLVETYVHRQVCAGALDLADAQRQIAADWTSLLDAATRADLAPKQHTADGDESD